MRKRTVIISLICILSVTVIMMAVVVSGRKPYKDLEAVQIVSATVQLSPPDKTIQIAEMKELVDLLKDVIVYNEDNSYTEYSGQGVTFTLVMTDGTQTSIMAYNPFLVIDGVGYKTRYEPCEALNHYANMLLENTQEVTFQATVIEVTDDSILVKPEDGSLELHSADTFSIPDKEKLSLQIEWRHTGILPGTIGRGI